MSLSDKIREGCQATTDALDSPFTTSDLTSGSKLSPIVQPVLSPPQQTTDALDSPFKTSDLTSGSKLLPIVQPMLSPWRAVQNMYRTELDGGGSSFSKGSVDRRIGGKCDDLIR
jgi:hypothetical protein